MYDLKDIQVLFDSTESINHLNRLLEGLAYEDCLTHVRYKNSILVALHKKIILITSSQPLRSYYTNNSMMLDHLREELASRVDHLNED